MGRTTIELLGLNREELVEVRRDRLAEVLKSKRTRALLIRHIEQRKAKGQKPPSDLVRLLAEIEADLGRYAADKAEYAAMARAALR